MPTNFSYIAFESLQTDDGLDRAASFAVLRRLIDLFQIVKFHQPVERKTSLRVQFDETRNKDFRDALALKNSVYGFPGIIISLTSKQASAPSGAAPTIPQVPVMPMASIACRRTSGLAVASSANSAPPPVISLTAFNGVFFTAVNHMRRKPCRVRPYRCGTFPKRQF
jgi:hypothetical protein